MPKSFTVKYPSKAHVGNTVSHAKNRNKRVFRRNLHTVTVVVGDQKQKMKVPTRVLKQLKAAGVTTHYKNRQND